MQRQHKRKSLAFESYLQKYIHLYCQAQNLADASTNCKNHLTRLRNHKK